MLKRWNLTSVLLCLVLFTVFSHAGSFYIIPDLPGGVNQTTLGAISGDGTTATGRSGATNGYEAYSWTIGGGTVGLGVLDGSNFSSTTHTVSYDGSVVYGNSNVGSIDVHAFRYAGGIMTDLGAGPGGYTSSNLHQTSWDGTIAVGDIFGAGDLAVRWTSGTGFQTLGDVAGGSGYNGATAISGDGNVIAGYASLISGNYVAYRWTSGTGMQSIGSLSATSPGITVGAVNYDGSEIVGTSFDGSGNQHAFLWTQGGGMIDLGDMAGGPNESHALATTANGYFVYGSANGNQNGFIWDPVNGMRDITTVLANEYGLAGAMGNVLITSVTSVSADGSVIAGDAFSYITGDTVGWVAVLPEPATYLQMAFGLGLAAAAISRRMRRR